MESNKTFFLKSLFLTYIYVFREANLSQLKKKWQLYLKDKINLDLLRQILVGSSVVFKYYGDHSPDMCLCLCSCCFLYFLHTR